MMPAADNDDTACDPEANQNVSATSPGYIREAREWEQAQARAHVLAKKSICAHQNPRPLSSLDSRGRQHAHRAMAADRAGPTQILGWLDIGSRRSTCGTVRPEHGLG